jgi:hypothetical protein
MKRIVFLCLLFSWLTSDAQEYMSYTDLLKSTQEVWLSDSLYINTDPQQKNILDSSTVKKWFSTILPGTGTNRLKNRNYYLTGKITSNDKFNILVLLEEKKRSDSNSVQVVYLITTKKDGTYIASLEAAISGIRKKSSYNTSSWLYKDNKLVLGSKITVNEKSYDDLTSYKINSGGRFLLSGRYE